MWFIQQVNQVLATLYRKVRIRDILLKTQDNGILQVRNDGDSDYADIDVRRLRLSGLQATLTEYVAIPSYTAAVAAGGALVPGVSTSQMLNVSTTQGAGANGDKRMYRLPLLAPGSYQLRHLFISQSASGMVDFKIEDSLSNVIVSITSVDHYTGVSTFNRQATATFTLPAYDATELYLTTTVNGKHASSTGFAALMTLHELTMLNY